MSKDLISFTRTVNLAISKSVSDATDAVLTEADVGNSRNGLLVISKLGAGSWGNIGVFSSDVATILTVGSAGATGNLVRITQDTVNSAATTTISSKVISSIPTTSGVYIYHLNGLSRYVNIQYDPSASDTAAARRTITATIVGTALEQQPYSAARTAY